MENKCPFCGCELPEEASFCLACFTTLKPPADINEKKEKPLLFFCKMNGKKLCAGAASLLAFLIVMGICIYAMKQTNSAPKPMKTDTTVVVEETYFVAVTEENGAAVTNESGEQVTDVVEVTKIETLPPSTTEKQGFFDKLFNSDTKKDNNSNDKKTDTTTEKKGFFDQIVDSVFGEEEKEPSTPPTTQATATVAPGTTAGTTLPPSTTQPPVTTEKPTQPVTSAPPTTVGTTAVTTTESGNYYFEYDAHYPSNPNGNIKLTKFVGNASIVTIPSYIDGKKVSAIYTDCFLNNSVIKEIHFDDTTTSTIILYSNAFNNLSSLTKIVTNSKGVHMDGDFAKGCPITYIGKNGSTDNKLVNGAYYKGSTFYWFTDHPSYTTLTLPDWCTKIDNSTNLGTVTNLKVFNIHKNVSNIQTSPWRYGKGLKEINVEKGHPTAFSHDGVLFYKLTSTDKTYSCIYPYSKTDKVFKLPADCYLDISTSSNVTANAYLEELWLPATSYIRYPDSNYFYNTCYPNLKTIYIAPDHPQHSKIAKTFKGDLIVTEF